MCKNAQLASGITVVALFLSGCCTYELDAVSGPLSTRAEPALEPPTVAPGYSKRLGANRFELGCKLKDGVLRTQKYSSSCWAACIESVFRHKFPEFHEDPKSEFFQDELVGWAGKDGDSATGDFMLLVQMLAPGRIDDVQKYKIRTVTTSLFSCDPPEPDRARFVRCLQEGRPLVIALRVPETNSGHVYVAWKSVVSARQRTRDDWFDSDNSKSEWLLEEVTLWDPTPGAGNITMNCTDMNERFMYYLTPEIADEMLARKIAHEKNKRRR